MSIASRKLKAGDYALTDFNGHGMTLVKITERIEGTRSQSGVCFRVSPSLNGGNQLTQFDADWFEPAAEHGQK